jgi:hypothetical protein
MMSLGGIKILATLNLGRRSLKETPHVHKVGCQGKVIKAAIVIIVIEYFQSLRISKIIQNKKK